MLFDIVLWFLVRGLSKFSFENPRFCKSKYSYSELTISLILIGWRAVWGRVPKVADLILVRQWLTLSDFYLFFRHYFMSLYMDSSLNILCILVRFLDDLARMLFLLLFCSICFSLKTYLWMDCFAAYLSLSWILKSGVPIIYLIGCISYKHVYGFLILL